MGSSRRSGDARPLRPWEDVLLSERTGSIRRNQGGRVRHADDRVAAFWPWSGAPYGRVGRDGIYRRGSRASGRGEHRAGPRDLRPIQNALGTQTSRSGPGFRERSRCKSPVPWRCQVAIKGGDGDPGAYRNMSPSVTGTLRLYSRAIPASAGRLRGVARAWCVASSRRCTWEWVRVVVHAPDDNITPVRAAFSRIAELEDKMSVTVPRARCVTGTGQAGGRRQRRPVRWDSRCRSRG